MSTRSAIITTTPTGYTGIYCHSCGYPSWLGNILHHHFTTQEQATALVALGSISSISAAGEVNSYHRDRGEPWNIMAPSTGKTSKSVASQIGHNGHVYLFENGAWSHNGTPISEVLSQPEIRAQITKDRLEYPDLPPPLSTTPPLHHSTTPSPMSTTASGLAALKNLSGFISRPQSACLRDLIRNSEERGFFIDKMIALESAIAAMPVTYQQDGLGDQAIAHLHYFIAGSDFYITEKDKGAKDDTPADFSLPEILSLNAELDLHFSPTTLATIKNKSERSDKPQPSASAPMTHPPMTHDGGPAASPSSPMTNEPMTNDGGSSAFSFRSYQREDLARSAVHDGAVIAWDPGLGKTMAIFAWPYLKGAKRVLIVAPASLHDQIIKEGESKFRTTVTPIPDQATALSLMRSGKLPLPGSQGPSSPVTHDPTHDSAALPTFFLTDYRWLGYNGGDEWAPGSDNDVTDVIRRRRMAVIARFLGMASDALGRVEKALARAGKSCRAYELLGVPADAARSVIKAAYREIARLTHPDLHPEDPTATERMQRLNQAVESMLGGNATDIVKGLDDEVAEITPTITELMAGIGTVKDYPVTPGQVTAALFANRDYILPESSSPVTADQSTNDPPHTIKCLFTPTLSTLLADCFDCVVADEAVRLKSGITYIASGVLGLRPKYRLALTGTPIKNRLPDVFFLASWVCGGKPEATARWPFGNTTRHQSAFANNHLVMEENLTKEAAAKSNGKFQRYVKQTNKITNVHRLWKLLGPVIARRRKDQIGGDIVGKTICPIQVMPGTRQQEVYQWHLANPPECKTPIASMGAQLQNLRQAALCPWSGNLAVSGCGNSQSSIKWSPKLIAILNLAASLMEKGEQLVVFSPFQEFSTALKAALTDACVPSLLLDGRVKNTLRGPLAAQFKERKFPILIAGIDAMGEGHSFECASHLVIPSLSWAYDANRQAIERVHRITSRKDVTIYTLVTSNTIDERLAAIFGEKGDASDLALDGRLFEEDKEEVSLADLLRSATLDFDPTAATLSESSIAAEWELTLRRRLNNAAQLFTTPTLHSATPTLLLPTTPPLQPSTTPSSMPVPCPATPATHPEPAPSNIIQFPTNTTPTPPKRPRLTPERIAELAGNFS